ncbi:MAG: MFS transporter, partial [Ruthenibacterium sp.]
MRHRIRFFAQQPPTKENLQKSRKILIAEGAVAAVIMSLATGNFMAGYLTSLGASVSFCALMGTLPQLGCVLQMAAPFLFEKLHYRKGVIWGLCVFFRFSLGLMMLMPIFFHKQTVQLGFTFVVYFFAFAAAGLVTPGLQQMTVDISPKEHRGAFFARKDIISACVNSAAVLVMGRQLDYFSALGQTQRGYWVVGLVSLLLAAADAAILGAVHEQPAPFA